MSAEHRLQEIRWLLEKAVARADLTNHHPAKHVLPDEFDRMLALANIEPERKP